MSGLYNLVLGDGGENDRGAALRAILGNPPIARYRDSWIESWDGVPVIAIYTRQGGGNRDCYCEEYGDGGHPDLNSSCGSNEALQAHPLYLRDADDEYDCTYATFYFKLPDELDPELRAVLTDNMQAPVDMSERWQQAIDAIGGRS